MGIDWKLSIVYDEQEAASLLKGVSGTTSGSAEKLIEKHHDFSDGTSQTDQSSRY
jgi:hypothetical protein